MPPTALRRHRRLLIGIAAILAVFGSLSAWLWYGEARLPAAAPAEPKPALDGVGGLNVLTFNVWHGGAQVPDGAQAIADINGVAIPWRPRPTSVTASTTSSLCRTRV